VLLDEAIECPDENEYQKLIDTFRTKDVERKIFLLFNPTSKAHWIFKRFYLPDGKPNPIWLNNHCFIHSTYLDNYDNLDSTKVKEWELSKVTNPDYFNHHIMGQWVDIGEGQVFKNWSFESHNPPSDAEILYGLDWGFASDPTALIRLHKKGKNIWVEELMYHRGLTNEDIVDYMKSINISMNATIYADSSEPKSIESLRRLGYRNCIPAAKGPDSVRAGINRLHEYNVNVNPKSTNLIEEYYNYAYRTGTDKTIDAYNHLMDAIRYAMTGVKPEGSLYTVMGRDKSVRGNFFNTLQ
jgi:phage terminase large subunit